jgi:uncharacterized membrane protein YhaH (DUF805 family)
MLAKRIFSFKGKANRFEYSICFIVELIENLVLIFLFRKITHQSETFINICYIWLIHNCLFLPIQATITRRIRDIGINGGYIFLNFIPIINCFFKIYLLFKKSKSNVLN